MEKAETLPTGGVIWDSPLAGNLSRRSFNSARQKMEETFGKCSRTTPLDFRKEHFGELRRPGSYPGKCQVLSTMGWTPWKPVTVDRRVIIWYSARSRFGKKKCEKPPAQDKPAGTQRQCAITVQLIKVPLKQKRHKQHIELHKGHLKDICQRWVTEQVN